MRLVTVLCGGYGNLSSWLGNFFSIYQPLLSHFVKLLAEDWFILLRRNDTEPTSQPAQVAYAILSIYTCKPYVTFALPKHWLALVFLCHCECTTPDTEGNQDEVGAHECWAIVTFTKVIYNH